MPSSLLFDISNIDLDQAAVPADEIPRYNPQVGDMRQLDHVIWLNDDLSCGLGVKHVRDDEFWVAGHIPGRPLLPGVLMIEAAAQLSSVLYLLRIWVTATLFTIPFITLLGLFGALIGRARRTISMTVMYWIGVNALAGILVFALDSSLKLEYLYPTVGRFNLLVDDLHLLGPTAAYLAVFSAIALGLGLLRFKSRDL